MRRMYCVELNTKVIIVFDESIPSVQYNKLFNLRLLLLTIKRVTNFNMLKTVNREEYQSFSDTCCTLGLIEDDE